MTSARKILVIGCPGAGKSTFSIKLGKALSIKVFHLDMIQHRADKSTVDKEEFDQKLDEILSQDEWIIDGNYTRTLSKRLQYADKVFMFDLNVQDCLAGAKSRIGTFRPDFPYVEPVFDPDFEIWIKEFPDKQLPKVYQALSAFKKEIVVFHTRKEADEYLESIK